MSKSGGSMKWLVVFVMSLLTFNLQAQQGSFSGVVRDAVTGQALSNAEVIIQEPFRGTVTDRYGMFSFLSLSPASYKVEVRYLGYVTQHMAVEVRQNATTKVTVSMVSRATELSPFEVREQMIQRAPYVRSEVLRIDMLEAPSRDVGDQLRQTPNVSAIRKGGIALDPVVRGFRFGQLNVQVDNGMKIEGGCPNRMDPTVAHIETEEIEKMEVIKGPYALRYGPVMGGVINIQTIKAKPMETWGVTLHGIKGYESNWNGNREYLAVSGGNQQAFFRVSGSKKDYGNYDDGNGNTVPSSFRKYSYKLQGGVEPLEGQRLLLTYESSKGRDVDYAALPMDERSDDTELWMADYTFSGKGEVFNSLKLKLYRSDVMHVMDNKNRPFSDTTAAVSSVNAINQGGRIEAGFLLGGGYLYTGLDVERITKDGDRVKNVIGQPTLPIFVEELWNEAWINNLGLFAEYRKSFGKTELITAARLDLNAANSADITIKKMNNVIYFNKDNNSSYTNISMSAGLTRRLSDYVTANLALGRGVRSPDMLERFIILLPVGFDRFDYLGDPKLKPEANHQVDLTFNVNHPVIGQVEVNGFYSYITDYITGLRLPPAKQTTLTQGVLGVKRFYNADKAILKGFEFMYSSPVHWPVRIALSAAYTRGTLGESVKYSMTGGQISGEEKLTGDPMPEMPPFESNLSVHWPIAGGRLTPRVSLRMVSAQNYLSDSYGEDETPGFNLVDLAISYRFSEALMITAGVKNLFDLAYYEHLNRRMILSRGDMYEPGRLFFVNLIADITK